MKRFLPVVLNVLLCSGAFAQAPGNASWDVDCRPMGCMMEKNLPYAADGEKLDVTRQNFVRANIAISRETGKPDYISFAVPNDVDLKSGFHGSFMRIMDEKGRELEKPTLHAGFKLKIIGPFPDGSLRATALSGMADPDIDTGSGQVDLLKELAAHHILFVSFYRSKKMQTVMEPLSSFVKSYQIVKTDLAASK